jgi:2-polyprenyl-3-methyl-5-hydroxy-6-metoxy-1,4-benzoquinol methylase
MDDLARYNKARWEELAKAGVIYSRPKLDLNHDSARVLIDPEGKMDDPAGKDVLCLGGGGGQQSAAFALLGAVVTVLDLCDTQLERDREAARHYGLDVCTISGDMRDLSRFERASFDIVWHAHSLNFVPDVGEVFDQVVRVLRPGGQYRLSCWNPMAHGLDQSWNARATRWRGLTSRASTLPAMSSGKSSLGIAARRPGRKPIRQPLVRNQYASAVRRSFDTHSVQWSTA